MIIPCPYCGPRDLSEFTYQGDATRTRPNPASTDEAAWYSWVYERPNPAGWHREFWQHSGGCRAHLVVHRNTLTHEIGDVAFARDMGSASSTTAPRPAKTRKTAAAKPAKPTATTVPGRPRATRKGDAT